MSQTAHCPKQHIVPMLLPWVISEHACLVQIYPKRIQAQQQLTIDVEDLEAILAVT